MILLTAACVMLLFLGSTFAETPPDIQWLKTYEAIDVDVTNWVEQTRDGGYILATRDAYLIKTNAAGAMQWQVGFGTTMYEYDSFNCVKQTLDGGYIITGSKFNEITTAMDLWLIKTNAEGAILWEKTQGGVSESHGYSVQQTRDGGYIVAGSDSNSGTGDDIYLLKTDSSGETQW